MARLLRICFCFLVAMMASAAATLFASAQTAPSGWSIVANAQGWRADSPNLGSGRRARLVFYPAVRSNEPIVAWLERESLRRAGAVGRVVWSQQGVSTETNPGWTSPLVSKARTIVDARGVNVHVFAWAYETRDGRQLLLLLRPNTLAESHAAVQSALDHIGAAVDNGRAYVPGRTAPPPVVQAPPPTQTADAPPPNGQNCRREPIWGFRRSVFCQPSGVCADREIRGYEWVCD